MAKDPAFLFYPNDYIGGTMGMTFEEKGAYMEVLMMQFNRGHMTEHMIRQTIGQLWDNIKDKFIKDNNGKWYNQRLEEEKIKRQKYTESRKNNKKGTNQHTKRNGGHMTEHMEDVNINENKNVLESIMQYFGFTEMRNFDKMREAGKFVSVLITNNQIETFREQFESYKQYKELSKDKVHSFKNFLGNIENKYIDGGWNSENWTLKLKSLNKINKTKIHDSDFN